MTTHSSGGQSSQSTPSQPTAQATGPLVEVRRSGGFAGRSDAGQVSRDAPEAGEVRELLERVDFAALGKAQAQPDRFVYVFHVAGHAFTVYEQQMTDELSRLTRLALGR